MLRYYEEMGSGEFNLKDYEERMSRVDDRQLLSEVSFLERLDSVISDDFGDVDRFFFEILDTCKNICRYECAIRYARGEATTN